MVVYFVRTADKLFSYFQSSKTIRRILSRCINKDIKYSDVSKYDFDAFRDLIRFSSLKKHNKKFHKKLFKSLGDNKYLIVAKKSGFIYGCVIIKKIDKRSWFLSDLTVRGRFRGAGIGTLLVQKAINIARKNNAKEVVLKVNQKNNKAIALYYKMGFKTSIKIDDEMIKLVLKL